MAGRRLQSGQGNSWVVADISDEARVAAENAATSSGIALEIWLAETVLRACQEGAAAADARSLIPADPPISQNISRR